MLDPTYVPRRGRTFASWAIAATLAAVTAGVGYTGIGAKRPAVPAPPSVAVLPIANLVSGAAPDDYFTVGLTDDLVSQLATAEGLRVVPVAAAGPFGKAGKTTDQIAAALGVTSVLEGSVQRRGDRFELSVRLRGAIGGNVMWEGTFAGQVGELARDQQLIARRAAFAVVGHLPLFTNAQDGSRTVDFAVLDLCAKGRYYARLRTDAGISRSISLFTEAVARDPRYALARTGLADAYTAAANYGVLPRAEAYARAASEAEQAVVLSPNLPDAHAALGYARKNRYEWADAEQSFRRAIALKPSRAQSHHWYSILLTQLGRIPESITEARAAVTLDPGSIGAHLQLAAVLFMGRRYDDALNQYTYTLSVQPDIPSTYRNIGLIRTHQRLEAPAVEAFAEAHRRSAAGADDQELAADRGFSLATFGHTAEAMAVVESMKVRYHASGEPLAASIAAVYAALGDLNSAVRWLQTGLDGGDPALGYLLIDPRWDGLRDDARFDEILRRLKLR